VQGAQPPDPNMGNPGMSASTIFSQTPGGY
jgi:hypothetical protein